MVAVAPQKHTQLFCYSICPFYPNLQIPKNLQLSFLASSSHTFPYTPSIHSTLIPYHTKSFLSPS